MIKNVTNLDEGINKLIDISNENISDFKVQENGTETHWDSGKHRKTYRFSIDINTNNKEYSIGFEQSNIPYEVISDNVINIYDKINISELAISLSKRDCIINEFHEKEETLENYYINLVGGEDNV